MLVENPIWSGGSAVICSPMHQTSINEEQVNDLHVALLSSKSTSKRNLS